MKTPRAEEIAKTLLERLAPYPAVRALVAEQLREWPAHATLLDKSLAESDEAFLARTDALAQLVWKLVGDDIDLHCADYHWMCDNFVEEYMFFRRSHKCSGTTTLGRSTCSGRSS